MLMTIEMPVNNLETFKYCLAYDYCNACEYCDAYDYMDCNACSIASCKAVNHWDARKLFEALSTLEYCTQDVFNFVDDGGEMLKCFKKC